MFFACLDGQFGGREIITRYSCAQHVSNVKTIRRTGSLLESPAVMNELPEVLSVAAARVLICPDAKSADHTIAEMFVNTSVDAIAKRGNFFVALSGGSTPRPLYELLAASEWRDRVDWTRTQVFWGDERFVPPENPASNFRMARQALLSKIHIPESNIHRVITETGDAQKAAADYEATLRKVVSADSAGLPRFDLMLLGVGLNAHTASLFPGADVLQECRKLVAASFVNELNQWRITMTIPVLNHARQIVFQVYGAEKASVVKRILNGPYEPEETPAQLIVPDEGSAMTWVLDRAAAARLPR